MGGAGGPGRTARAAVMFWTAGDPIRGPGGPEFARSPGLIAGLARYAGGDIELAEELAQDAVVAALEQWPNDGVPAKPGAWLMTVAKRRAVDLFRRNRDLERKYAEIGRDLTADDDGTADFDRAISDDIDD